MDISSALTISIATKDRAEVVDATLRKIHGFGLGECPLVICDDGSFPPINPPSLELFPRGRLIRNEQAQGQASARNRIAWECRTPYLLQLDDDSYPVAGDVKALVNLANDTKDWLAFALPFDEPARGRSFARWSEERLAIQVKSFVGCSVLIHVDRFKVLGGYAEWIRRTVEEDELCLRAIDAGLSIQQISIFRIRHEVSAVTRDAVGIGSRSMRNWVLTWLLHAPAMVLPWRILRLLVASALLSLKLVSLKPIKGFCLGFSGFLAISGMRAPMSHRTYREFTKLPHALSFFKK